MKSSGLPNYEATWTAVNAYVDSIPVLLWIFMRYSVMSHMACPAAAFHKGEAPAKLPPTFFPSGISPQTCR